MALVDWRPSGDCLKAAAESFLSRNHSVKLFFHFLRAGTLQAKGVPDNSWERGWEYRKGGELEFIPTHFWLSYDDLEDAAGDLHWPTGVFFAGYHDGNLPKGVELVHAYRCVEFDWAAIKELLESEDLVPPFFLAERRAEPEIQLDEPARGPGRGRSEAWNHWIAEVALRAWNRQIVGRSGVSALLRALGAELRAKGLTPPPDGTVREAAAAVLKLVPPPYPPS